MSKQQEFAAEKSVRGYPIYKLLYKIRRRS